LIGSSYQAFAQKNKNITAFGLLGRRRTLTHLARARFLGAPFFGWVLASPFK
jgi:hypothetical protein